MYRIFLVKINQVGYEKKDLNIPFTKSRTSIGTLSGMVTNAIFLSHSLREKVIVRLIIEKPTPHIIQIQTDKIRYLGPEERSLASILLKAERKILDQYDASYTNKWFQPNPGLFACQTDNWFFDLEQYLSEPVAFVHFISNTNDIFSGTKFEDKVLELQKNHKSTIYYFDLVTTDSELDLKSINLDYTIHQESVSKIPSMPKLVGMINIILDKKEDK